MIEQINIATKRLHEILAKIPEIITYLNRSDKIQKLRGAFMQTGYTYIPGQFYDNALHGYNQSTVTLSRNYIHLTPYRPEQDITIDLLGVRVTSRRNSLFRLGIYEANDQNLPGELVYTSPDMLDTANSFIGASLDFEFKTDKLYWLAVWPSNSLTVRANQGYVSPSLSLDDQNANRYHTMYRRASTFLLGTFPQTWDYQAADARYIIRPPNIRFRIKE